MKKYMEGLPPNWKGLTGSERRPTWNLAPSSLAWAVRNEGLDAAVIELLKWGFTDEPEKKGLAPINARVESAEEKFYFRQAWEEKRCFVPADGWYEWRKENGVKQPYYFTRHDDKPIYFAGLWTGQTFCLFTTAADDKLTTIHDRKPLALEPSDALDWIIKGMETEEIISAAVPGASIKFHPVSRSVSNWRNDNESLINPL